MDSLTFIINGRAVTDAQNIELLTEQRIEHDWIPGQELVIEKKCSWVCGEAIDRLAAYEETGLTPEELKALVLPLLSGDFRTPSMKKEDENAAKYFLYKLGRELKNTP